MAPSPAAVTPVGLGVGGPAAEDRETLKTQLLLCSQLPRHWFFVSGCSWLLPWFPSGMLYQNALSFILNLISSCKDV